MSALVDQTSSAGRAARRRRLLGAALALAAVAVVLVSPVRLVVVPLLLALFPAALLMPLQHRLGRAGVPPALAAALLTTTAITVLVLLLALAIPMMAAQLPALAESVAIALRRLADTFDATPVGIELEGLDALFQQVQALTLNGDPGQQVADAAALAGEVLIGAGLLVVVLFFYLKDGRQIATGLRDTLPARWRPHAAALGVRSWATLGNFFRGQLLVAGVDAVFIGLGLVLLGVPLALPLALLVFVGGLFPIVGAVVSGAVAVLVAFADGGVWLGLAVLALVVGVQQLETNLLQPVIMSRATAVHPLIVILAITLGGVLLGVLGAFLAVPVAACTARALDYAREEALIPV